MTLLDIIVLAASKLPGLEDLCLVSFVSLFGAFLGQCVGRARQEPRERVKELAFEGGFAGFGIGFALWLAALPIDRL